MQRGGVNKSSITERARAYAFIDAWFVVEFLGLGIGEWGLLKKKEKGGSHMD